MLRGPICRWFVVPCAVVCLGLWTGCNDETQKRDVAKESLEITFPAAGEHVDKSRVRVRGEAPAGVTRVDVNGEAADVAGGTWDVLVDFEEGPATVHATADDFETSVDFVVDTSAPVLELEAPERGIFVDEADGDEIFFEGTASDEVGELRALAMGRAVVEYDEEGRFSYGAALEPGYNEFELRAVDEAGNEAIVRRAVMYGPLVNSTDPIDSAAGVVVDAEMYATLTEVIEAYLTPARITDVVQRELADEDFVDVDQVDFEELSVDIEPMTGGGGYLAVEVDVTGFRIDGAAHFQDSTYPATLIVDALTITSDVYLSADGQGGLDVDFDDPQLDVAGEDMHFEFDGTSEEDLSESERNTLQRVAESAAETAFAELLDDELVDALYDPDLLRREVEIMGRVLEFELQIQRVRITSQETFVDLGVAIVSDRHPDVPEAPGAIAWPTNVDMPPLERDLLVASSQSALDRILHGLWRSGLINIELAPEDFEDFDLPVDLNAGALGAFLDGRISDLAGPDTPVGFELRPQLPPAVALGTQAGDDQAESDVLEVYAGDLLVDIELLPEDGEPIEVATLALFLDVEAVFDVEDGRIILGLDAEGRADLDSEPTVDLDDEETEDFVTEMIGFAVERIGEEMELTAAYELDWLTIEDIYPEIYGEEDDQLSVEAELEADVGAIE